MLQCPCHFPPLERPQFVEVPEMDCKTRLLEMLPRACIMCVRVDRVERERERNLDGNNSWCEIGYVSVTQFGCNLCV